MKFYSTNDLFTVVTKHFILCSNVYQPILHFSILVLYFRNNVSFSGFQCHGSHCKQCINLLCHNVGH